MNDNQRILSSYQRFVRDNNLARAKSLLLNDPAERIFWGPGMQIIITPADFRNGKPTNNQVIMKLVSMWNQFDNAAKMAY